MKRWIIGILTGCLALILATGAMAGNATHKVYFIVGQNSYNADGQIKQMDAATFIEHDRTYVPVRFLGYALGVSSEGIKWQDPSAILAMGDTTITLTMGSRQYQVNGQTQSMDVTPINRNGRIYLPARFVAEAFGYEVGWDNVKRAVLIGPKGELPSLPVIDITGQGEPIAGKPWANYFDGKGTVVNKDISDLNTQSFKIHDMIVHGVTVTRDEIIVTIEGKKSTTGIRVYMYENDNLLRARDNYTTYDKGGVHDFKYPVLKVTDELVRNLPPANISKMKYIFLKWVDTILVINNPLYKG
ncbi:stalk domain-containing protein [Desulforamulus ruminis]|uniref:Copper amine oxidase-like domain-containing protein n=1 Tax=Desulforamulus ruminis (strain ATCC 23193 / DSM 2154 / NCIMB 8452 / DL) TaxID=696281 RepID=F6DTU5_DESRL|nr:stalk domain-containing protein [Desulforamulus ruminis]AEG58963.1 copper amine oxidase-like domain-containing protein [Desulforamulus ruminis DSM 2154]